MLLFISNIIIYTCIWVDNIILVTNVNVKEICKNISIYLDYLKYIKLFSWIANIYKYIYIFLRFFVFIIKMYYFKSFILIFVLQSTLNLQFNQNYSILPLGKYKIERIKRICTYFLKCIYDNVRIKVMACFK